MSRTAVALVVVGLAWTVPGRAENPPPPSCTGTEARVACAATDVGKACATGGACLNTECLGIDGGTMTLPQCVPGVSAGAGGAGGAGACTPQNPCHGTDGTGCSIPPRDSGAGGFSLGLLLAALAVSRLYRRRGSRRGGIMERWHSRRSRPTRSASGTD